MDTAKIYKDSNGDECNIHYMVKYEPEWAAKRIQEGEKAIEQLAKVKAENSGKRNLNLVWGENLRDGKYHLEWHAPCGCAYHPEPAPHVHQCYKHRSK